MSRITVTIPGEASLPAVFGNENVQALPMIGVIVKLDDRERRILSENQEDLDLVSIEIIEAGKLDGLWVRECDREKVRAAGKRLKVVNA